jgi:hypothetical protein
MQSEVEIIASRKRMIGKDKHLGHVRVPIPTIAEKQHIHEWYDKPLDVSHYEGFS